MYVLADLEWVENAAGRISFTQCAMIRTDEHWEVTDRFFQRIRPMDASFCQWSHVGYIGGSINDFLQAPTSAQVFRQLRDWLRPEDTLCWWYADAKQWLRKLVPAIANPQIVLYQKIADHLGLFSPKNAYSVGRFLKLESPGVKHDARNDAEMMRRVLSHLQFPQPIPEVVPKDPAITRVLLLDMNYPAHVETNTIHKRGCPKIPETGTLKGYNELTKPIGKGFLPCSCVKAEYLKARRQRSQSIIDRSQYNFLYSPNSSVFHRRDCKIMLQARELLGTVHYRSCLDSGRTPCKLCKPSFADEHLRKAPPAHNGAKVQKPLTASQKSSCIAAVKEIGRS